jgi:hypothetical protein
MRLIQLTLATVLALAATAHADGDKAKAEQYFRAGALAFKQQSFAAAAEQFEQAYREAPLPEIAFSAAQAYRRQYFIEPKPEYVKRAVELYTAYLDKVKSGGRVGDASDGLAEMKHELDRLTASGAHIAGIPTALTRIAVSVTIAGEQKTAVGELSAIPATDTTGVSATVDGKPVELFTPLQVEPGEHDVTVTAPGYFPVQLKRRVVDGITELVEAELKPEPAKLVITTDDNARVEINGRFAGDSPLAPQELPAGAYTITLTRAGREPIVREVALGRGETKTIVADMHKTTRRKIVPWLAGGAGAFAIASTVTAIFAESKDHDLSALETRREATGWSTADASAYTSDVNKRDELRTTAWVLGGAAVATGAVAAALYFFDRPQPTERAIDRAVVPTAGPHGAGVSLVGRF